MNNKTSIICIIISIIIPECRKSKFDIHRPFPVIPLGVYSTKYSSWSSTFSSISTCLLYSFILFHIYTSISTCLLYSFILYHIYTYIYTCHIYSFILFHIYTYSYTCHIYSFIVFHIYTYLYMQIYSFYLYQHLIIIHYQFNHLILPSSPTVLHIHPCILLKGQYLLTLSLNTTLFPYCTSHTSMYTT